MKKVVIWLVLVAVAIIGIPLSFVFSMDVSFNVAFNAFFNNSLETTAFFFLQFLLVWILGELLIYCEQYEETTPLSWANVFFLIGFALSKWYLYYLMLALMAWIAMAYIASRKNKKTDEITQIIQDVKEEYTHQ